jgi:hypothetical protein
LYQEIFDAKSPLTKAIVSQTAQFAIICSTKPSLIRWDLSTYKTYEYGLLSPAHCINFSSDEQLLAIGDDLYRIVIYDVVGMEKKRLLKAMRILLLRFTLLQ